MNEEQPPFEINRDIAKNRVSNNLAQSKRPGKQSEEFGTSSRLAQSTRLKSSTINDLKSSQYQSVQPQKQKVPTMRLDKATRNFDSVSSKANTDRGTLNRSQISNRGPAATKQTATTRKHDLSYEGADNRNFSRDYADNSEDDMSPTEIKRTTTLDEESGEEEMYIPIQHIDTPKHVTASKQVAGGKVSATSYKTATNTQRYNQH